MENHFWNVLEDTVHSILVSVDFPATQQLFNDLYFLKLYEHKILHIKQPTFQIMIFKMALSVSATNGELFLKRSRGYCTLKTCWFFCDAAIIQRLVLFETYMKYCTQSSQLFKLPSLNFYIWNLKHDTFLRTLSSLFTRSLLRSNSDLQRSLTIIQKF